MERNSSFLYEKGGHDPPSKRSDGFQWFLAFYINFMTGSKGMFRNTVLLLDNPGVYLHPSGQRDLLKTLENIAKNNQIVFTTHSPFLVDRKNLRRIRLVLKKGYRKGTKIEEKLHHSNYDTLEPIRAAIGMSLSDTLFPFKNDLLVEGYSDTLILEAMSLFCERIEKSPLKPEISVIHAGTDRIPFFSLFFEKEGIPYAILLDNDTEGRRVEKQLIDEYGIGKNIIIRLDAITPDEAKNIDVEIEDLIDPPLYNRAVNEAYSRIFERKKVEGIKIEDLETSINKQTKKYMKFFRDKKLGGFDKIMVAKQIYNILGDKNCTEEDVGMETLESFNKLLQLINTKF